MAVRGRGTTPVVAVALEVGAKRCFASALDWPGWARAGRTPQQALEALEAYADRYREAMAAAGHTPPGLRLPARAEAELVVTETLPGDATTDFGAPSAVAEDDRRPTDEAQARRLAAAVRVSWAALDASAAAAPAELRTGPRGGGRDRDAVVAHVIGAHAAYARMIGVRVSAREWETPEGLAAAQAQVLDVLARPSDGAPLRENGWPARYATRRMAWHVLDHAWEITDRADPAVG
jgi:hypothetical protein